MFENTHGKKIILFFLSYATENTTDLLANSIRLKDMVSDANGHYYHYAGSLTTPTCNEAVTWNVMQKPYM